MENKEIFWRWTLGAAVGVFLLLISLYPQIRLWQLRGAEFNGVYAYNDLDETAYAAYLQALIDDRPRRNNPYTGIDDRADQPQPESLFSIQFFAPSVVALAARFFNVDASTAMIVAGALAALATALIMFWLALALTENPFFAAAATLIVLCCGVLAIGEGAIGELLSGSAAYPYFPFLRRYVPAIPFAVFWLFCISIWLLLVNQNLAKRVFYCVLAALCFAALVYSYFYLWTAAAAWLGCLTLIWLFFRPDGWRKDLSAIIVIGIAAFCSLLPYVALLANRDRSMDEVQLLIYTRMPDLLRPPEILSYASLALLCLGVWQKFFLPTDKIVLFTASFALLPFAVFNQQIFTGRSLQPIHYQVFIANYAALFAFCLALFLLWRQKRSQLPKSSSFSLLIIALIAAAWGVVEAHYTTEVVRDANVMRDEAKLVADRLRELAQTELFDRNGNRKTVLSINLLQGDDLPALAPQATLWARHGHVFTGESWLENKRRFYQFLYFAGVDRATLESNLRGNEVITVIALFGWDRLTGRLSTNARPLTEIEIKAEVESYSSYRENFDHTEAMHWQLSYLVLNAEMNFDFTFVDRWYKRDAGERIGNYVLYQLKVREQNEKAVF